MHFYDSINSGMFFINMAVPFSPKSLHNSGCGYDVIIILSICEKVTESMNAA